MNRFLKHVPLLSKIAEATRKFPLEEPDHWIKLSERCTP